MIQHGIVYESNVETDEDQKGEVIGSDLGQWSANAGDGQLKGTKYLPAAPGRGLFVRRASIASLPLLDKGERVRLVTFVESTSPAENKREVQVQLTNKNKEKENQVP